MLSGHRSGKGGETINDRNYAALKHTLCDRHAVTMPLSCRCHDNSHAADLALITTKIPRFHLTQESSTPNNLMGRVKTMWAPCMFRGRPPVPLKKVANGDIWFFTERDWIQGFCHGNNIVGVICLFCDVHYWCQV